jgi:hypothetical protein
MTGQIEVFPGQGRIVRGWFVRLRGGNGEVVWVSESYSTKWSAKRAARHHSEHLDVPVVEKPYARYS